MEKYINQLLGDIQQAHRHLTAEEIEQAETVEHHIEEVERYLEGEDNPYQQPFSYHCGLSKEQFPPADRLTYEQLCAVCDAFENLLISWNIHADLPDEVPVDLIYKVLVDMLEEKITIVTSGFIGWEFCDYIPEACVFKEHCTCKVMFAEMDERERQNELLVQRLIKSLRMTLAKMPKGISFSTIHYLSEEEPKPEGKLQALAIWVGINLKDLPKKHYFNGGQLEAICDALLGFWAEEDEIHNWIAGVNPYTKYKSLVEFLETEVWFLENHLFVAPPMNPEEMRTIISPLDSLPFDDLLDFPEEGEEEDFPF